MIDKNLLQPGDILLYKPKSVFHVSAWFITWAQNVVGKNPLQGEVKIGYCHVALVDYDTDYILEARWPKSKRSKLDWDKLDKEYDIELWRLKDIEPDTISKMLSWAHEHTGEWYDLGLFLWGWMDKKHEEVCSTFVSNAAAAAGKIFVQIKHIGLGTLITPDEIAGNTDLIERIK